MKNCLGDPLSVALWCDTVHLVPGSRIGGRNRKATEASREMAGEDEALLRAQMAEDAVGDTGRRGAAADVVRAMLDPAETLAVWKDEGGRLRSGLTAPDGMAEEKILLAVGGGEVLQIDFAAAKEKIKHWD